MLLNTGESIGSGRIRIWHLCIIPHSHGLGVCCQFDGTLFRFHYVCSRCMVDGWMDVGAGFTSGLQWLWLFLSPVMMVVIEPNRSLFPCLFLCMKFHCTSESSLHQTIQVILWCLKIYVFYRLMSWLVKTVAKLEPWEPSCRFGRFGGVTISVHD